MDKKYKKLNELYETIDSNMENCIKESGIFKDRKTDTYYSVIFLNSKYIVCSVYIADKDFKDYYDEKYINESLEEWLTNSNLQKVMDINNFQDIFLENICGRCDTLEELIIYLIEVATKEE